LFPVLFYVKEDQIKQKIQYFLNDFVETLIKAVQFSILTHC